MSGNKKKRSSTLIILLIAMVVLLGACFWLIKYKDKQSNVVSEENTAEDTTTIISLEADSIQSIYFSNDSGEMTLSVDEEGIWRNAEDLLFPVNQTYAVAMKSAITEVTSSRTITSTEGDFTTYGLDSPIFQVVVTTKDGTATTLTVGNETPVAGGYYATINDTNEVYIVESTLYYSFKRSLTEMLTIEEIPGITAEYITYLSVENKDKPNFEISFDEDNYTDFAGFTSWMMKQPYPTEIPADSDAVTTLLENYTAMSFSSCVDYHAKDLSKYGLDDPTAAIKLDYYEVYTKEEEDADDASTTDETDDAAGEDTSTEAETTKVFYQYELIIGSMDEDGNYYAKSADSNAVHTISASTVATLTEIDAYSNAYHYTTLINIESIDSVDVEVEGETYTLGISKVMETVDDVETEVSKYYYMDELVDETAFKELYQLLISSKTEREIPADYFESKTNQNPYMVVTYHFKDDTNKKATIEFIPYDESYYIVNTNGVEYFLTDLRKVNEIANAIVNFKSK